MVWRVLCGIGLSGGGGVSVGLSLGCQGMSGGSGCSILTWNVGWGEKVLAGLGQACRRWGSAVSVKARNVGSGVGRSRTRPGMSAGVGKSWIVGLGTGMQGLGCRCGAEREVGRAAEGGVGLSDFGGAEWEWTVARWGEDRHDSSSERGVGNGLGFKELGRVVGRWNVMACQIAGDGAVRHGSP